MFESFDLSILQWTTRFVGQSNAVDLTIHALSSHDIFKGIILFALLWFVWFLPRASVEEEINRRGKILYIFFGCLISVALSRVLQLILNIHQRPFLSNLGLPFPSCNANDHFNGWNSFPSDHMALFYALAMGLWFVHRRASLFAFLWAFIVIGLPRIYLGVHYPSDILGGMLLGVGIMQAIFRIEPIKLLRKIMVLWERHAASFYAGAFVFCAEAAHLFDDERDIIGGVYKIIKGTVGS